MRDWNRNSRVEEFISQFGDELTKEFKVERDTLGRWMAHDLAEMLSEYKAAKGSARIALAAEIRKRIFQFSPLPRCSAHCGPS